MTAEAHLGYPSHFLNTSKPDIVRESLEKGKRNKRRAIDILSQMAEEGLIAGIKTSTLKQKKKGIDAWVYTDHDGVEMKIPFQFKSSLAYALEYRNKRKDPNAVAFLIVNDSVSDYHIRAEVARSVVIWKKLDAGVAEVVNAPV
ncbi:MAG: hypothetical protein COU81_01800 [Candidatus Portnoybacteria bacterium CG10_big_fil_rev_8_21_14_0_10_36_7]|uniref:Uncharacterized protein n=1 Tax=Candidatus Portnoybacteria bacterium CG10_big_fil_rev_8_21_14_0_10_36_7 TaxID=1974812 RepID=A0A2M8KEB0_9BACT|nr:MAG: hypothetical protein COU81_01800 [Candidatus Portnoybacteria bacterium CG10_big_fil_rev_8_21_14_0_10_36_7]